MIWKVIRLNLVKNLSCLDLRGHATSIWIVKRTHCGTCSTFLLKGACHVSVKSIHPSAFFLPSLSSLFYPRMKEIGGN